MKQDIFHVDQKDALRNSAFINSFFKRKDIVEVLLNIQSFRSITEETLDLFGVKALIQIPEENRVEFIKEIDHAIVVHLIDTVEGV